MPESVEDFLGDLDRRYPVDERFRRNIRPLVKRIFDQSISGEERRRLLHLVEQTYRRQVENRENMERAKEGIRRIFSNLYRKILKDLGPQIPNLKNRVEDEGERAEGGARPDRAGTAAGGDERVKPENLRVWEPRPVDPREPVWGENERAGDPGPGGDGRPPKKDLLFGEYLVKRNALDRAALLGALEEQVREKPLLGWVGLRRGVLSEDQLLRVLTRQVNENRRFGDIAIEEGFLDSRKLAVLCRVQRKYTPRLGKILVSRGDLSQDALDYFLEEFEADHGRSG